MTAVGSEVAEALPPSLLAITVTTSVSPAFAETMSYVEPFAPPIGEQLEPVESHADHWYVYDVGLPVQVPCEAAAVLPVN
jgi:hypothetical protein